MHQSNDGLDACWTFTDMIGMDSKWSDEETVKLVEHRPIIRDEFNIEEDTKHSFRRWTPNSQIQPKGYAVSIIGITNMIRWSRLTTA